MRLASFNLLHGRSLSDGLVVADRLAEAVGTLDVDVLGLQEVDRGQARSDSRDLTREAAETMGTEHWRFVPALTGTPGETWQAAGDADITGPETGPGSGPAYGVGLVSKYPVKEWRVLRLPAAKVKSPIMMPGTKKVIWLTDEPRVAVAAVLESPIGLITVATTHLSFVPGWNGAQLRKVCRWLEQLPGPRILLGDLNMPPPFPAVLSRWSSLAKVPTYPSTNPKIQLDHVLASGHVGLVRSVDTPLLPLSDHRALVVTL